MQLHLFNIVSIVIFNLGSEESLGPQTQSSGSQKEGRGHSLLGRQKPVL